MMRIRVFVFLIFSIGCDIMELPVAVEPAPQKLAVSSLMLGQAGLVVSVSRSFSTLSGRDANLFTDEFIESLLVRRAETIFRYGSYTDTLRSDEDLPGFFLGLTPGIRYGDSLFISIRDPESGLSANAATTLIEPVAPDSLVFDRQRPSGPPLNRLTVYFPDFEGPDWYAINAYSLREMAATPSASTFFNGNRGLVGSTQFSDRGAKEGRMSRSLDLFNPSSSSFYGDTLLVTLSHIEEGYFRFLDARRRSGGIISSFLSEPLNYPDNIENGYGYFSAHQPKAVLFIPAGSNQQNKMVPVSLFFSGARLRFKSTNAPSN